MWTAYSCCTCAVVCATRVDTLPVLDICEVVMRAVGELQGGAVGNMAMLCAQGVVQTLPLASILHGTRRRRQAQPRACF